jgi:hypothetical protein
LNAYLPARIKQELDPILSDVKLMVNLNDKLIDKHTIIEETLDRLGMDVLESLPKKVGELINQSVNEEIGRQNMYKEDYGNYVTKELNCNRILYKESMINIGE